MHCIRGMTELADMHLPDLVLAPAEKRGPGRVDADEVAIKIRDAEEVLGDLPDAVALAGALRDFLLERARQRAQRLFLAGAFGRLDAGGKNATDAVRRAIVGDRAVADREASFFPFV